MIKCSKVSKQAKIYMLVFLFLFSFSQMAWAGTIGNTNNFPYRGNLELDKRWTIKFSTDVDRSTINKANIKISMESNKEKTMDVDFLYLEGDNRTVVVKPISNYLPNTTYNLTMENVKSTSGKSIKSAVALQFTTKPIGSITAIGKVEMPVPILSSIKRVTIQNTNLKGAEYFKIGTNGELLAIGQTGITLPEDESNTVSINFYDNQANCIGTGIINVKELGDSRVFDIDIIQPSTEVEGSL